MALLEGRYDVTTRTLADGEVAPVALTSAGLMKTDAAGGGGGGAATIADGADVAEGAVADAAVAAGAAGTVSAKLRTVTTQLNTITGHVDGLETAVAATNTSLALIDDAGVGEYEAVAASQTDQAIGATGATGDWLGGVLVIPATTSPGIIQIQDGAGTAITVFTGGASSVSNLVPFMIPLGIRSTAGAWSVTTGANVSALAVGNFT